MVVQRTNYKAPRISKREIISNRLFNKGASVVSLVETLGDAVAWAAAFFFCAISPHGRSEE